MRLGLIGIFALLSACCIEASPSWYFTNFPEEDNHSLGKKSYITRSLKKFQSTIKPRGASMISGRGFGPGFFDPSISYFMTKRASGAGSLTPRGASMISGRGFGPGFFDTHSYFVRKRSMMTPDEYMQRLEQLLEA
ncbi:unnamed protein product [Anisakis simplex]|uniref:Uncharacterized protein n=1 Tax=Anisakis simplex TaxID=6269 RepID=A0A0M3JSI9_ANISI|nr:unnamed protein product [Anisakis simplex]